MNTRQELMIGSTPWYYLIQEAYFYVYDEEGDLAFSVNTNAANEYMVIAAIYGYIAGLKRGHREGVIDQQSTIQRALGLSRGLGQSPT
jgi:hypothetical protein